MNRPASNTLQKTNSPFKQLRLDAKLSQEELARKIGVVVSTVRRWEKGEAEPTMNYDHRSDEKLLQSRQAKF